MRNEATRYLGLLTALLLGTGAAPETAAADRPGVDGASLEAQRVTPDPTRPIIVVAGMLEDRATVAPIVEVLRKRGLDVTVWVPANLGLNDINGYAKQLGTTVDQVRRRTNAAQVDFIGHSQGGVTARRYLQLLEGDAPVHTLVSLGSPQQGSDFGPLADVLVGAGFLDWALGAKQLAAGSPFLAALNEENDPTPGEVRYVSIGTIHDQVTTPVANSGVPGGENVVMQEHCPGREVGHFGLLSDAWVHQVVFSVLAGGEARGDCAARPLGGPT